MANVERLLKMANFLDRVHPIHFDLDFVTRKFNKSGENICRGRRSNLIKISEQPEKGGKCGTAACACGFLPAIFPNDFAWDEDGCLIQKEITEHQWWDTIVPPFLELELSDFNYLFVSAQYDSQPGPKDVAARIREFCSKQITKS